MPTVGAEEPCGLGLRQGICEGETHHGHLPEIPFLLIRADCIALGFLLPYFVAFMINFFIKPCLIKSPKSPIRLPEMDFW